MALVAEHLVGRADELGPLERQKCRNLLANPKVSLCDDLSTPGSPVSRRPLFSLASIRDQVRRYGARAARNTLIRSATPLSSIGPRCSK